MVADVVKTVKNCAACAKNRIHERMRTSFLKRCRIHDKETAETPKDPRIRCPQRLEMLKPLASSHLAEKPALRKAVFDCSVREKINAAQENSYDDWSREEHGTGTDQDLERRQRDLLLVS
jgi:hypothetical protein